MDLTSIVPTGIAIASLGVSLFVLRRQHKADGRAHFTAEWDSWDSLAYVNHGPGNARDVRADLNSDRRQAVTATPYVGARQVMRIRTNLALGETIGPLSLTWRDNRRGEQHIDIHLPAAPVRGASSPDSAKAVEKAIQGVEKAIRDAPRDLGERMRSLRRLR